MKRYDKIIFISTGNTFISPLAESLYRVKSQSWMPDAYSRGLVVLFEEPISPKVNRLLTEHQLPVSEHSQSRQLVPEDMTAQTLVITMTLAQKVEIIENFEESGEVYTIGEYIGLNTDVQDPYGSEDSVYEDFYQEIEHRISLLLQKIEEEYHAP